MMLHLQKQPNRQHKQRSQMQSATEVLSVVKRKTANRWCLTSSLGRLPDIFKTLRGAPPPFCRAVAISPAPPSIPFHDMSRLTRCPPAEYDTMSEEEDVHTPLTGNRHMALTPLPNQILHFTEMPALLGADLLIVLDDCLHKGQVFTAV